ncbi:metabolite-proton symporter [Saccharopolyspora antimicrobica]|uniref:Putative proline/betaine transporter n=1 Tax=Saccharopolyspora antimicrobica TaxID=455193 RepID=A0A1I5C142_9PSEU|nr:MFS transporter [Saccharopolyspora antimicrobica]RKT89010.1 metabolite-proton symporter [Saccharopolyspora antimicrobica]SFN80637.1 metabolite-proton symporter [Saccharopolyspora antimicrobica]
MNDTHIAAGAAQRRDEAPPAVTRRTGLAGMIGTTIEWYDFYIYGLAAALVFGTEFFPEFSPAAGTLAAFATFAVGFIARPLGGVIFGHFGDRVGRKNALMLTLFLMGAATVLVGLLPNYHTIGIWAPVLLVTLRFLQGFAVGGEWGGAVTMVVESAPDHRRGFYGSLPQMGVPLGLVLSTTVFAAISPLPDEALRAWGWRIPFLLSIALIGVGLFIRSRITETPTFVQAKESGRTRKLPAAEAFRNHWKAISLTVGLYVSAGVPFYIVSVFVLSYGTTELDLPRGVLLTGMLVAALVEALTVPWFGALSDKLGRRPVFLTAAAFTALLAFPFFWLLESGQTGFVWLAMLLALAVAHAGMYGPTAALYAELFSANVRYTGTSIGYQLGGVVAGFVPLMTGALVGAAGGASWPISALWAVSALIGLVCALIVRETRGRDLRSGPGAEG